MFVHSFIVTIMKQLLFFFFSHQVENNLLECITNMDKQTQAQIKVQKSSDCLFYFFFVFIYFFRHCLLFFETQQIKRSKIIRFTEDFLFNNQTYCLIMNFFVYNCWVISRKSIVSMKILCFFFFLTKSKKIPTHTVRHRL